MVDSGLVFLVLVQEGDLQRGEGSLFSYKGDAYTATLPVKSGFNPLVDSRQL